jgi:23S rRNA pseudouridine2605 synthase
VPAERLQKLLARAGYGSRRHAETLIEAGRVSVDGHTAHLGERADLDTQLVTIDGRPLALEHEVVTLAFHKPAGVVTTSSDERGRRTVYDALRASGVTVPTGLRYVGRLDRDTEGLLLMTTDGALANRLAHPRHHVRKVYEATLDVAPSAEALAKLRSGVDLEDGRTAPAEVELVSESPRVVLRMVIHEGRTRQVRRMCAAVGCRVLRLVRVQVGPVHLGRLLPGASRALTAEEWGALADIGEAQAAAVDASNEARLPSSDASTESASDAFTDTTSATRQEATISTSTDSMARCVAIDGATASGKSVVGRALAERLGYGFFDTGLMYRACTLAVLRAGIDPEDTSAVVDLVRGLDLDVAWPEPTTPVIRIDGNDVSSELRTPEIERTVSLVSRVPEVREELVRRQRAFATREPLVMVGRDIGTHVLKEARTKLFLEASAEVRAKRRLGEELDSGRDTSFEQVLLETRRRDELDATGHRAVRREQAAADAVVIDTDLYGIEDVVHLCIEAYEERNPEC